jgi:hypothetical protein
MSRYTFICEQFDYDEFTGDKIGVLSKTTKEISSEELYVILENFESFLKGSGFRFDGHLEIIEEDEKLWSGRWNDSVEENYEEDDGQISSEVIKHMMNDLQKNPITMKSSSLQDEFGDIFIESNDTTYHDDLDYGEAQPTLNVMTTSELENITLNFSEMEDKCDLCKLPKNVMRIHKCFDPQCPIGAYHN